MAPQKPTKHVVGHNIGLQTGLQLVDFLLKLYQEIHGSIHETIWPERQSFLHLLASSGQNSGVEAKSSWPHGWRNCPVVQRLSFQIRSLKGYREIRSCGKWCGDIRLDNIHTFEAIGRVIVSCNLFNPLNLTSLNNFHTFQNKLINSSPITLC